MAKTHYGKTIAMDAIGVVKKDRIRVKSIELVPNAAGDTATFESWYGAGLHAHVSNGAVAVSSGVVGSTGNFTAAKVTALDVIHFTNADLAANKGIVTLVASRDNDNQATVGPTTDLTDDASGVYTWDTYTPQQELIVTCDKTTDAKAPTTTYVDRWFNNLVLTQLSASAKVYIYYE